MSTGATSLAKIGKLIAAHRVAGEDARAIGVRNLQAADKELAQWAVDAEHGAKARVMQAELSMALRQWQIAAERWRTVSTLVEDQRDFALCRAAFAHRKAGNLFAAQRSLDEVAASFRDQKRYVNEMGRVQSAADAWVATQLSGHALQWLIDGQGSKAAHAMFTSAALRGYSSADLASLQTITDLIASWQESGRVAVEPTAATQQHVVALAGFGWSGSGAVADYLRDFPGIAFPAANTELTFFEGKSSVAYSLATLLDVVDRDDDTWRSAVGTFLGWTVLGLAFPPGRQSEAQRWHRKSLGSFMADRLDLLVGAVATFLQAVGAPIRNRRTVGSAAQRLFVQTMGTGLEPTCRLGLNNSIHARHIDLLEGFEDAVGVVVVRDPRDQFVARMLENERNTTSCRQFIRSLRADRQRFAGAMQDEALAARIMVVRFETFVTDPAERKRVADFVGVAGSEGERAFDAVASGRNVGIYRTHRDQTEIRRIEAAFPDLV